MEVPLPSHRVPEALQVLGCHHLTVQLFNTSTVSFFPNENGTRVFISIIVFSCVKYIRELTLVFF